MNLILTAGPNPASHVVVIQLCYLGARSVGDQFLQNMMSWEGERCLLKDMETRTFLTQQDSVSQVLSAQRASLPPSVVAEYTDIVSIHSWEQVVHPSKPDELVARRVHPQDCRPLQEHSRTKWYVPHSPACCSMYQRIVIAWLFEIAAGAIADPDPTSSCFPLSHRVAPFQVAALYVHNGPPTSSTTHIPLRRHQWKSSDQDDRWTTSARDWINDVISPYSPGGSYPCFLESKEGWEKVRDTFGKDNWERLVGMKRRWDPQNQLMNNFWPNDLTVSS